MDTFTNEYFEWLNNLKPGDTVLVRNQSTGKRSVSFIKKITLVDNDKNGNHGHLHFYVSHVGVFCGTTGKEIYNYRDEVIEPHP